MEGGIGKLTLLCGRQLNPTKKCHLNNYSPCGCNVANS